MNFDDSIAHTTSLNGSALSLADYIAKIRDFLVNNAGFTLIDERGNFADPLDKYIVVEKNGIYYHFLSYYNNTTELEGKIFFNINKDYNNSLTFWQQTNTHASRNSPTDEETKSIPVFVGGVPQYYFYWNGRNFYIITEFSTGYYSHLSLGLATSYQNKEAYFMTSTSVGNYTSLSTLDVRFHHIFGESTNLCYESWQDNIADDFDTIILDAYSTGSRLNMDIPSFNNEMKTASFISIDNKALIWSPNAYLPNRNSTYFYPIIKHSDNFIAFAEYFNNLEEFTIGLKTFKFFPFFQKTTPANFNLAGRGCGICIRIA